MKRYLCWLSVLGVIAIPAVAAACWPTWGRPAYAPPMYSAPMYSAPMYAPMPVYVQPQPYYPQPQGYVLPPPRIEAIPKAATATPAPAPAQGMGTSIPSPMPPAVTPTRQPVVEPVRPASGSDAPPKMTDPPAIAPAPSAVSPETAKGSDLDFPKVEIPKSLQMEPKLPPLKLPKEPDMSAVPKVPAVGATKDSTLPAIPSPAPAPESLIPPPSVPLVPDPNKRDPLPSLTLPPDIPVAPSVKPEKTEKTEKTDSTSRSSPLTGGGVREFTVSVFPAASGEKLTGGYRTVGFFNHTNRDLALTIEGRAVKLPAKTYLHAQLAATFTWSHGDKPAAREIVPDGAAGLDVVFRE